MYEDDAPKPTSEKRLERPLGALEEAEKARLQLEATFAAREVLPAAPPRDFA